MARLTACLARHDELRSKSLPAAARRSRNTAEEKWGGRNRKEEHPPDLTGRCSAYLNLKTQ
jgi:hypothetical protein